MQHSPPAGRVSVRKNAAGLYAGYVGSTKAFDQDGAYNAKIWLAGRMIAGAEVSPSSCFSAEDVEKYKSLV